MTAEKRASNRIADLDPARLARLEAGAVESRTLAEGLAVDFARLMRAALPEAGENAASAMAEAAGTGITRRMALAAALIRDYCGTQAIERLSSHPSDTVRGWACFMIGADPTLDLPERLARIRPFADDPHFGVREWSWLAVRSHLAQDIAASVALLAGWTGDPSPRIRRFASESIRPRGVWCAHIALLKRQPEIALPVLESLRADPDPYVQDSVGNWLNDAAKDHPDWVLALCERWMAESPGPATARICRRGQRGLGSG